MIAIAIAVFLGLGWVSWRRTGTYVAPDAGRVGGGIAMLAVGGVLVVQDHAVAGGLLDLVGVISMWAAFRTFSGS